MTRIAINGHDLSEEVEGDGSLESMRPQQTGVAGTHRVHAYEGDAVDHFGAAVSQDGIVGVQRVGV